MYDTHKAQQIRTLSAILREQRGYSSYRAKQAATYMVDGYVDFEVVDSLHTYRGQGVSPSNVNFQERSGYKIICRPATTGAWGKGVVVRAIYVGPPIVQQAYEQIIRNSGGLHTPDVDSLATEMLDSIR